jgi:hypothetical protein
MALSQERKGEIALLYVRNMLYRDGIKLSQETQREIVNKSKQIGVSVEEATEFAEEMVRDLVEKVFPPKK